MASISLELPDDLVERLNALRKLTGQNEQYHLIGALREYLQDLEDLYAAEQIAADIDSGRTHTVPLGEVLKDHGVGDPS